MRIIKESIEKTLLDRPNSKVDWSNSPFLPVKNAGKNAVGDFGEHAYHLLGIKGGNLSSIVKKGHDVLVGNKKVEVKTSFQNKQGRFSFNQLYEHKDFTHIAFVFVWPNKIEVWECQRPIKFQQYFTANNGWMWSGSSPSKLDKTIWTKTHEECHE